MSECQLSVACSLASMRRNRIVGARVTVPGKHRSRCARLTAPISVRWPYQVPVSWGVLVGVVPGLVASCQTASLRAFDLECVPFAFQLVAPCAAVVDLPRTD